MINPTQFSWTGSNEREDNTPYLPEDRRGYEVAIRPDGTLNPDLYIVFTATSQEYDFVMPLSLLGNPLGEGDWLVNVRDVDTEGRMSAWAPDYAFGVVIALPKSPTGLVGS